jgi:tetratricopeptide (TPR) repeat protein/transglutaminase-like putative cysteine protease
VPAWLLSSLLVVSAVPEAPPAVPDAPPAVPAARRFQSLAAELARDHADPRALAVLAEMRSLEEDLADLPGAAAAYARIAGDRQAHPEVRAWARLALVEVYRARGMLSKAQAEIGKLGLVQEWLVAGPFDDEGKKGFDAVYPPEEGGALAARMAGKVREVRWRPLPPEARQPGLGISDLGASMRPAREAVGYALATLESPREQRVRLYLGASGAVKLWVNGALALAERSYHPVRLDQFGVAVSLRKGPNRILVKVCHQLGRLGVALRAATAAGEPLRLAELPAGQDPPPAPAPGARPEPVASLVSILESRAEAARGKGRARARLDLALALAEKRSAEDRERRALEEARSAVRLAPGWAEARLLAARLEPEGNRQREHLEAALAASPGDPAVLRALGAHHLQLGRPHRALPILETAARADPGPGARLLLADAWEAVGLGARAHRIRIRAAADFPLLAAPAGAAARSARNLDRLDEAAGLWRKALALRFDDAGSRYGLEKLLADRGDVEDALLLLEEALKLDPVDLGARLRQADLLAANGNPDRAEAAYAAAQRICPEEEEVQERRGRARLRAGRTADAVADFQAALELRPQNPQLKELLRAVQPQQEGYERPYLLDARELARAWERESAPAREPAERPGAAGPPESGDDAVVLGELRLAKVFPSGLSSRYQQLVVKVLTPRGADALRRHTFGYEPGRQEIRVDRARVTKPDGTAVDTAQETDRSASEPWYRLWYDTRARTVALPALAAGDVLELAVRTDDVARENLLADYFGDVVSLADRYRRLRWEYVVLMPPGREIHASETPPGVTRTDRAVAGGTEHRFSARDTPRIPPEPGAPGWSEIAPFVHVSTFANWDQVASFWWGLAREQLAPNAEVREAALRVARETREARRASGLPPSEDERAIVEAIHAFVVTNIRYVGLEFGIHGFKPYRVDEVLSRRFGDCKDKAGLTHALLQVLGIDSRLVLLRMRHLGAMPATPASLSIFNHAVTWVPRYDLWLDGTASFHGTRELPGEDREASVLVVNPGAPARFQRTPGVRAEENSTESQLAIRIAADGSAAIQGDSRIRGAAAPGYRRAYQAENDRKAVLEQAFARTFPGLRVVSLATSDLSRLEEDVQLRFQLAQPRFAERHGEDLVFSPFGGAQGYTEAYAPISSRRLDLALGDPYLNHFAYRIDLPEGTSVAELPGPARAETPFGSYEIATRAQGDSILAEGRIAFRAGRVAAADYPAFREFVAGLDRALGSKVVLRRARQARGERSAP